jgi:hypothetical protein
MTTGAIYARFEFAGERVYEVKLPGGGATCTDAAGGVLGDRWDG